MACIGCKRTLSEAGRLAAQLMLSVSNAIHHAIKTGEILAPKTTITERIRICGKCQKREKSRCKACGCYIVAKAGLIAEKCPDNKWPN